MYCNLVLIAITNPVLSLNRRATQDKLSTSLNKLFFSGQHEMSVLIELTLRHLRESNENEYEQKFSRLCTDTHTHKHVQFLCCAVPRRAVAVCPCVCLSWCNRRRHTLMIGLHVDSSHDRRLLLSLVSQAHLSLGRTSSAGKDNDVRRCCCAFVERQQAPLFVRWLVREVLGHIHYT